MIAGDLPSRSRITGQRFYSDAAITACPVIPEPVNTIKLNGNLENPMPTRPVTLTKISLSSAE